MAETRVFTNSYLRQYIFHFLRKKPKVECTVCKRVINWDGRRKQCDYVRLFNQTYYCTSCSQLELSGMSCTIT